MKNIELLAPARNLACGIAAIDHGADAVYIGASRFGARAAAGNSVSDIRELIRYAHLFRVKVFVALNTVLTDDQTAEAERLIWELYRAGADAIIIQDMGIMQMNLPPVVLHASTQTDNRTVQKVKFLQDAGFSRVVLARELTLNQISKIASQTDVELEAFVHGSLCVSYSGQCYISEATTGRSANRGECAQFCRLPYTLYDAEGNILQKDKHLLSLKDLDLSEYLGEMMEAGIISFKIEGRLKEMEYVKNITAYYRMKLDEVLGQQKEVKFRKASSGSIQLFFEPNPEKSFRRSSTDYFLNDRHAGIYQPETPKSVGEPVGSLKFSGHKYLEIQTEKALVAGDGLCYFDDEGKLKGFRVNKVEQGRVYPLEMPVIQPGTALFRNQDHAFDQLLAGKSAERKIRLQILLKETSEGFVVNMKDEDDFCLELAFPCEKTPAKNPEKVQENIIAQFSKSGNTPFAVTEVQVEISQPWFFPVSVLNEWRRASLAAFENHRIEGYVREIPAIKKSAEYPEKQLTYLGNVTNQLAFSFYKEHGVENIMPGFEVKAEDNVPLMFTRHCIKYEMGWCPKTGKKDTPPEPFKLRHQNYNFRLEFDCKACEMRVLAAKS